MLGFVTWEAPKPITVDFEYTKLLKGNSRPVSEQVFRGMLKLAMFSDLEHVRSTQFGKLQLWTFGILILSKRWNFETLQL